MTFVKMPNRAVNHMTNGILDSLLADFEKSFSQAEKKSLGNQGAPANIIETSDAYHLEIIAPGRDKQQFKIQTENNLLTVSYDQTEAEPETTLKQLRKEFSITSFKRSFNLDDKVDADKIQAKYEDGILKLLLPKIEAVKPAVKEISIL